MTIFSFGLYNFQIFISFPNYVFFFPWDLIPCPSYTVYFSSYFYFGTPQLRSASSQYSPKISLSDFSVLVLLLLLFLFLLPLLVILVRWNMDSFFFLDFIYLFLERREGREIEREKDTSIGCLSYMPDPSGDRTCNPGPAQAGNWAGNVSVRGPHPAQPWLRAGVIFDSILFFVFLASCHLSTNTDGFYFTIYIVKFVLVFIPNHEAILNSSLWFECLSIVFPSWFPILQAILDIPP